MRRNTWSLAIVTGFVVLTAGLTFAQEGKPGEPPMTPEMKAMMDAMDKMCRVGDEHKVLEYMVGEWTTACKMRFDANAPWDESTGTCTSKWILDGRFVQAEHKGTMMGQPHTGIATTGYDTMKGKYIGCWMDNMCTGIMTTEGTYDASTKTFTFHTEMTDPMNPSTKIKIREVITIKDKDTHTFEWFETKGGTETKTMEITYTRKGAA